MRHSSIPGCRRSTRIEASHIRENVIHPESSNRLAGSSPKLSIQFHFLHD